MTYIKNTTAWVTWPDGHRELITATIDQLDQLYWEGCHIEIEEDA